MLQGLFYLSESAGEGLVVRFFESREQSTLLYIFNYKHFSVLWECRGRIYYHFQIKNTRIG